MFLGNIVNFSAILGFSNDDFSLQTVRWNANPNNYREPVRANAEYLIPGDNNMLTQSNNPDGNEALK